ncbi:hypothetical protein BKP54_16580 [Ensifer sp. 1H6]|nr:hypothetical protein BKP54_16580 [Ensifer sp. 1H6]
MAGLYANQSQFIIDTADTHRHGQRCAIWCPALQGPAFRRVIIPVVRSRLLDRTMLYTAITRGIETVVLVGDRDLINEIVAAAPTSLARNTALHFGF